MRKGNDTGRTKTTLIAAALLVVAVLEPMTATCADDKLTAAEAKAIAKEVFLWGMHPVAIYHLRYNFAQNEKSPRYVGINRLSWDRKPQKALPRIATTPNATTLYGAAMLDLSKEPVAITVPEIKDHYWSVQLHDNYARCWHMIGNQFNAPGPVRRLLIGPNWSGKLHIEDDKLVIYVQHDEPTDPKQRQNWLPAPKDGFQFAARFYGPYTPLIDGSYNMPGVVRAD